MPHITVNHFATALMTYLAERSAIIWRPVLLNPPSLSNEENEQLLSYVATVGRAVEKLSSAGGEFTEDEFEQLLLDICPMGYITLLLADYLRNYSALKFISYMSSVTSFSIFCHRRGHDLAPDFAVRTIIFTIHKYWWSVFNHRHAWDELEDCAQIINRPEFIAPTS